MKRAFAYLTLLLSITLAASLFAVPSAHAFLASEDEQFQADIREAVARARDFKREIKARDQEEEVREKFAQEKHQERLVEAERDEIDRRDFVRARNNRPSDDDERERLERLNELQREKEDRQMDANRQAYVKKRDQVRKIIEREASIDEMREYGL